MSNEEEEKSFTPNRRTFHIENVPRLKISLLDEKSQLAIDRIFTPIEPEKTIELHPSIDKQFLPIENPMVDLPSTSHAIMNIIDHQSVPIVAYNHDEHLQSSTSSSSVQPVDAINEHQLSSTTKRPDTLSSVGTVEQSLSPPLLQLIPDSIINDKQTTKRISNETNSTHLSKFIRLTPINSSENESPSSSSNHLRYYPIGSLLTSTSTFLLHQNEAIASKPFLSDTIFIILIATLTIIILLLCFGLFCLCRRTTKRNLSPSFDGGSYAGLNRQSLSLSTDDYEQRNSEYENNTPFHNDLPSSSIQPESSTNRPAPTNDRISAPQTMALHRTVKTKMPMTSKKLKKKRAGFCCCKSKRSPSTTVNARTRM